MTEFFLAMGYGGLVLGSWLLGWIVPFSTELLMAGCLATGFSPWLILAGATFGATASGMTMYGIGRLGNIGWLAKLLRIKPETMARYDVKIRKNGAWMALLAWIPYGGEAVSIAMGMAHTRVVPTLLLMTLGKTFRYLLMLLAITGVFSLV